MSRVERKYVPNDGNYTKQKYDYFEVELPVGYTRRYMREIDGEKIIELGCDIHPTFRKKDSLDKLISICYLPLMLPHYGFLKIILLEIYILN